MKGFQYYVYLCLIDRESPIILFLDIITFDVENLNLQLGKLNASQTLVYYAKFCLKFLVLYQLFWTSFHNHIPSISSWTRSWKKLRLLLSAVVRTSWSSSSMNWNIPKWKITIYSITFLGIQFLIPPQIIHEFL